MRMEKLSTNEKRVKFLNSRKLIHKFIEAKG